MLVVDPILMNLESFTERLKDQMHCYKYIQLKKNLGIKKWQVWIQKGPRQENFCIQAIDCDPEGDFKQKFKEELLHDLKTNQLHSLFQEGLTERYSLVNPYLRSKLVLNLSIYPEHRGERYDYCYMLPLLPKMEKAHEEYCRAAMAENKAATTAACKAFGMIEMKKWIQYRTKRSYVLYYQLMTKPIEESKMAFLNLKGQPEAIQATQTLRNQTGLSFDELHPDVISFTFA